MTEVLTALRALRTPAQPDEYALQREVAHALDAAGIPYQKECVLGPRNRIDFLCEGGVGIEIKRGKPNAKLVRTQAQRYCGCEQVQSIIIVVERSLRMPARIGGKPVAVLGLNALWGVAL